MAQIQEDYANINFHQELVKLSRYKNQIKTQISRIAYAEIGTSLELNVVRFQFQFTLTSENTIKIKVSGIKSEPIVYEIKLGENEEWLASEVEEQ